MYKEKKIIAIIPARGGSKRLVNKNISKLKKANFTRITNAGIQESHPHNVDITREAPNYSR